MKPLLIFAHVPPPHHGQSYMVEQLLEELRAQPAAARRVFHVDCRVSEDLGQVGQAGLRKLWRLLGYCAQAVWLRWQHGPMFFYYVPAPGKRAAIFRDWLVMALCRPFFRRGLILHWHAVGLGAWVAGRARSLEGMLTRRLLGGARLSLVLARAVEADQTLFRAERVAVLPNGIVDPCPGYDQDGLAVARRTPARLRPGGEPFRVLFLAHCTREKGLYDAVEAVRRTNRRLAEAGVARRCHLTVAGSFLTPGEEASFRAEVVGEDVGYSGFTAGPEKEQLFRQSDCFLFPTYYANEVMPVTLIEAFAYGLPVVSTRWRGIPEMAPHPASGGYQLVEPRDVPGLSEAVLTTMHELPENAGDELRRHFVENYRREVFGRRFLEAVQSLENTGAASAHAPFCG